MITDDIKKYVKENKVVFGTDQTLKNLKQNGLQEVFLSSNCPDDVRETVDEHAKISSIKVTSLDIPNDELGVICRKQFSISVFGVIKEK